MRPRPHSEGGRQQGTLEHHVAATASVAVASAGFGLLVLLGDPRRAPNRFLALFLFLLAANQALDVVRLQFPPTSAEHLLWFRLASVCAALDPAVLYAFAAIHPRRNALWRPVPLGLVLASAAAMCFLASQSAPLVVTSPRGTTLYAVWALYTAVMYGIVLAHMARDVARDPARPGARLLFAGLCLAALPAWPRFFEAVVAALGQRGLFLTPQAAELGYFGLWIALPIGLAALTLLVSRRLPADARHAVNAAVLAGALLTLVLYAPRGFDVTARPAPALGPVLDLVRPFATSAVPIRWWLFGLLVSTAIVRDQMLGLSIAARRGAARVLVAIGFLLAGVAALAVGSIWWPELLRPRPMDVLLLGALLVASQRFRALVDRVAARVYGVPLPGPSAAFAAYRSAARQAAHEPAQGDAKDRLLRLRGELGIDEPTARALEADARGEPGGPLVPGDRLSARYEIGRLLARGSAGRVFAAHDTLLQRDVVVKEVLHDDAGNEAAALSEARAAGALQHPNVLVVFDVLHRPGASYIITEPAEGGSLEDRLERGPPPTRDEAYALLDGILAGLAAVHERGLVHRDLKPANVVLLASGAPKIADFGLARLHRAPTLGAGLYGTPAFMSPEQRAGQPATRASDVYAIGLIAERLLLDPPPAVGRVLRQALAADPAERWPDARAMRQAFAQALRA